MAVFTVTGDSRVTIYAEPKVSQTIKKDNESWELEELIDAVPVSPLKDYVFIAKSADW